MQEAFEAGFARKFRKPVFVKYPGDAAEQLGNDWYDLRVQPISGGLAIKPLRARWSKLRKHPQQTLMHYLIRGMHVEDDPESEIFDGIRMIQRRIPTILPQHSPSSIVDHYAEFSTAAEVFTAGIIDLSDPSQLTRADLGKLGDEIKRHFRSGSKFRLEHVIPAAEHWLDSLR